MNVNQLVFSLAGLTADQSYYWRFERTGSDCILRDFETERPQGENVNYFTLSPDGELSYNPATQGEIIRFDEENKLDLSIYMEGYQNFSIRNDLKDKVIACQIRNVSSGAQLTGLGAGYLIKALLNQSEYVTVDNTPFVAAADWDYLELRMVGNENPQAAIAGGSVFLSKAEGQNKYLAHMGGSVEYDNTDEEESETAVATFADGLLTSITGLDQEGETVTVTSGNNVITTYEVTASGLKRTIGGVSSVYTGEVGTNTNVLDLTDENNWRAAGNTLDSPIFSLTLGNRYYAVTEPGALTGSDEEPTSGSYFQVDNGTISYVPNNIELSGKVTMNVNASGFTGDALNLYRGEENGATFTYKVTKLKATTVTNVAEGDTFATANSGEFSFTKAGGNKSTFDVTTDTATFCVNDSTVAIQDGGIGLSHADGRSEYSGSAGESVKYEHNGTDPGLLYNGAVATFKNGALDSITGLDQVGEQVTVTSGDEQPVTTIYEKTAYGIKRTKGDQISFYTGTDAATKNVLNITDWSDGIPLTGPTFSLTLGNKYYQVTAESSGKTLEGSDTAPESGSYFQVDNDGTIRYVSTQEGLPVTLSGNVTMKVDASDFTGGVLDLYRGDDEATFTYKVTHLNAHMVTKVARGDTFETATGGNFYFEPAGGNRFTFSVTTNTATFCVDDSTVAIKNGTVQLSSGSELSASGIEADDASDNVKVKLDDGGGVEVRVTGGEVKSITGLDNGETVTCGNTTYKASGNTIIKTETKTVDGVETKTVSKLTTDGDTGNIDLLSSNNTWVSKESTMGDVSLTLELTKTDTEQFWTLSGNNVTKVTEEQFVPDTKQNYFKLSLDGELTYTSAMNEDANIIKLGDGSKVTLKVDMSKGGETPAFSVNGELKQYIIDCDITGVNGATVDGFTDVYTFTAEDLAAGNSVTINSQKFTMAVAGKLELSGVSTDDEPKAQIQNGAIKLGVKNEDTTKEYCSTFGSRVIYNTVEASEVDELNGAAVKFENGEVSSITGIDVVGEEVAVTKDNVTTVYGRDNIGIYKQEGTSTLYYTGTVADDGEVDVISAKDWSACTELTLTNPTITITPELDDMSYYIVNATEDASGSSVTASKLNTEPTKAQNYFTVAKKGKTYKLTYTESAINPIHLKDSVTVTLNGSNISSGSIFALYQPGEEGAATFTYNVTALKSGAAFANVSSGDTFAAAAGSYSFTMVRGEEAQSYLVTAASNFVADESAVAMFSGTATLKADYNELVASGTNKTDKSDNVKVEFTGNDGSTATVKVAKGEVTSITGLQNGDKVRFTSYNGDQEETGIYVKTSKGFTRTVGEKSEAYDGTLTDVIAAAKASGWYTLGNVTFNEGVVLDLGTVTADSYYTLTKITEEGATVVKATSEPDDSENYFTVSSKGEVSYHQATSVDGTPIAKVDASKAKVKFAAQHLGTSLTLSGQGKEENGVKNYEVSGVKKDATVDGVVAGDIIKTAGTATVNDFLYESTAGALEIHGLAIDVGNDVEPGDEIDAEDDTPNPTALYSGTVNVFEKLEEGEDYTKTLTVGSADDERTETVTITSSVTTTTTGAVVTANKGKITVIKDLEQGEIIAHDHVVEGSSVTDTYTYNGTSIVKVTGEQTYTYDVAAVKNTNVLTIKETQWEDVTGGITAGEKIALNITLPATATEDGVFYEVTGSKPTNIKVAANASNIMPDGNFFQFFKSGGEEEIYSLGYYPAEDAEGSFSIKLGAAQANINATAIASGKKLNLSAGGEGYLPTYNVTGLKAGAGVISDNGVGFTLTTAALKAKDTIKIDDVSYTAGANGALKFEKDGGSVVFQSGTLKLAATNGAGVTARYVYTDSATRTRFDTTATITSTAGEGKDGVLLTATAAGGLTVKDLEAGETVTIKVGEDGTEYTYSISETGKLIRTDGDGVTSTYSGVAKFAATADVFAAINTDKWVKTYTVEAFNDVLLLNPTGVNAAGRSAATYYRVVLEKDESTGKMKVSSIGSAEYTVPTDANYFAVTATGAVTYHSNEYQKANLSGATVKVDYTQATATGAKFTTVARPKNATTGATTVNNVGIYEYVAKAGMTFTGITENDKVIANLNNNEKVTVNGTAFTAGADSQNLEVGIIKNELDKEVAALKSRSTILVKGTYYVATGANSYAKVIGTGNGVNVNFGDTTSISGFDKNEKIEVYMSDENGKLPKTASITYQVNAAGTMVIKSVNGSPVQQAALGDNNTIDVTHAQWQDLAFAGSATLTLNDRTTSGDYGVNTNLYNSATAAASFIAEGVTGKTTVGEVVADNSRHSFTADDSFKGNVKITTSGTKTWELTGSKGDDTFTLGTQATVKGSNGNDTITSSAKADYFDYTTAGLTGEDMIKSFTSTATVVDSIGVGNAVLEAASTGTDVKLTIGGKTVSIVGAVGKEFDIKKGEEVTAYIVGNETKANTFTLTNTQLSDDDKTYSLIGGAANDTFKVANNGTSTLDLNLETMAKRVEIFTATGSKSAVNVTNAGTFVSLTGGNAGDTIKAGVRTDWISGGKGADSIDFGDNRENGITYQLNVGDGIDTIVNFDKTKDTIYLGKGAVTSVTSSNNGVTIKAGTDSVVLQGVTDIKDIKNNLYTSAGKQISDAWYYKRDGVLPTGVTFAGNTITLARTYKNEDNKFDLSDNDDFSGWVEANSSTYNSLNITATAVQTALLIKGSEEANIIRAGGKVGVVTSIDGGQGNDTLYGGAGTDAFIFEDDYGKDTVYNFVSGKDVVILSNGENLTHTTTGANLTINTDENNSITLIGKANTRIDILSGEVESVGAASDYSTAYYFGKTTGANTYSVNAKDMLNAHFFGSDEAKDTLTITANGVKFSKTDGNELIEDEYVNVDLSNTDKFRYIDELNAQAVSQNLHIKSGSTGTTIKAGKGIDSIECNDGKDVIYYGGYGFGDDTINGFDATTDKLWVANTIKSVAALENNGGVVITFASGARTSTLTVMGYGLTADDLNAKNAVIASATATANATSWTKAYNAYTASLK